MMVADFITPSYVWDVDKVRKLVTEEDTKIIASIPISSFNDDDKWICHYNSNGSHSVKSGYKAAMVFSKGLVSSSVNTQRQWWCTL